MPVDRDDIERMFHAALEISDADVRGAHVRDACGGDAALLGEVEALLKAHEAAGSFMRLEGSAAEVERAGRFTAEGGRATGTSAEGVGSVIGRYKLLQEIGEGGFGTVFMAEQRKPVQRRVALKIIKPGMDSRQVVARFEAERQALAMMDHPNIARVLDGGTTEHGLPYFVMELVKGIPLTDYCDERRFAIRERLELFIEICRAVQHAHQKGIIHRDLKPSNILVTEMDGRPVPKVIDFGLAKALQGAHVLTEQTLNTVFGAIAGTPRYMAPEQVGINSLDVDTRTDIYSLGVNLYELLTGTTPLESERMNHASWEEIRWMIREQDPPKPSTRLSSLLAGSSGRADVPVKPVVGLTPARGSRSVARSRDGDSSGGFGGLSAVEIARHRRAEPAQLSRLLRGDLDWIVLKALEKDRTRRYETSNALARDIERYLSEEPVEACPPSANYRFRKFVRRHRPGVLAGTIATVALVLAVSVSTRMYFREREARDRAVAAERTQKELRIRAETDEQKAKTEAAKSRQVAQFLKDMLKGIEPSVARGRDTTMLREVLDETAQRVDKDLKDQPEVQIDLRLTLAATYHEMGLYEQMEQMARGTLQLARSTLGDENLAVANALGQVADAQGHLSRYPEAVPLLRQSIAMQRKLRGGDSLEEAYALYHLCFGLSSQGKHAEAQATARGALAMRRRLLGAEHLDVARALDGLSRVLMADEKLDEAEAAARESLDMRKRLLGKENPEVGRSLEILGAVLKRERKHADAEPLYRDLLPGLRKTLGENHPRVAAAYGNLSDALMGLNRPEESEAARHEAMTIMNRAIADFPEQRPSLLESQAHNHRLLGYQCWSRRNHSGAREFFHIATDLFRQSAEYGAPKAIATALQGEADNSLAIGQLWEAEARRAEAGEAYRKALALHERLEKEGRAQDITAGWVANHYVQLAQLVEKVATLEDALRIAQILHVPKQGISADAMNGLVNCRFQLARVLERHGHAQEAIQQLQNLCASLPADDPSSPRAKFNLASILRRNGKAAEAVQICLQAAQKCHSVLPHHERLTADRSRHQDCWGFAILYEEIAQFLNEVGQKNAAEGAYRDAQAIWIKLVAESNIEDDRWHLAVNQDLLGHLLRDSGRPDEAVGSYQAALGTWEKLASETRNPDRHIHLSLTRSALADLLRTQGKSTEAQKFLRDAEAACREALAICQQQPKDVDAWMQNWAFDTLSGVLTVRDDTSTLEAAAAQSVQNLRARSPVDEGFLAVALANQANILRKNGKLTEARPLAEEAVSICRRQPGRVEPWMQDRAFDSLRRVLTQLGDTAACAALASDWINLVEQGGHADQLASAYAGWIPVLMAGGREQEAEEFCRKLLALAHQNAMADNNVAWFLATAETPSARRPALAVELAKKAVELDPKAGSWWNTLGAAHYRAGEWRSALEAFRKSMELRQGGDAFDWYFLAMIHRQFGDRPAARSWYDKAVAWTEEKAPKNEELCRFRVEAAELIAEHASATQP